MLFFLLCLHGYSGLKLMVLHFSIQGSDFVSKAIDIAVTELIAVATPGEGMLLYLYLLVSLLYFGSRDSFSLSHLDC